MGQQVAATKEAPAAAQIMARDDRGVRRDLCVFVHGLWSDFHDWDTWVEVLSLRFPTWTLRPLEGLAEGSRFMGSSLDVLAELAAVEIVQAINAEQKRGSSVTLHCIGHSMGGLILRGALPKVFKELGSSAPELGHYLSLSSPHLGVQASWGAPMQMWRNLCWMTSIVSPQLAQLAIQDVGFGRHYLEIISTAGSSHMELLQRFHRRTCVTLASGDVLIPVSSGVIDPRRRVSSGHSFFDAPFWRFEMKAGIPPQSRFFNQLPRSLHRNLGTPGRGLRADSPQPASSPGLGPGSPCSDLPGHAAAEPPPGGGPWRGWASWVPFISCCRCQRRYRRDHVPIKAMKEVSEDLRAEKAGNASDNDSQANENSVLECARSESWKENEIRNFDGLADAISNFKAARVGSTTTLAQRSQMPMGSEKKQAWQVSFDGACRFPCEVLRGLSMVEWQRIVARVHHPPTTKNAHVFLIGKKKEQFATEHYMSRQCIEHLAELLVD